MPLVQLDLINSLKYAVKLIEESRLSSNGKGK